MNPRHFLRRSTSLGPRWARGTSAGRKLWILIGAETNAFGVPIASFSSLLEVVATLSKLGYEGFETNICALEAGASQPCR